MDRLNKARKNTDGRLARERLRTDEALAAKNKRSKYKVDEKIRLSREDADERVSEERTLTDERLFEARRGPKSEDARAREVLDDSRINTMRQDVDERVEIDRLQADEDLRKQRAAEKLAQSALFEQERAWTDIRLKLERKRTDWLFEKSLEDSERLSGTGDKVGLGIRKDFLGIISHDLRSRLSSIMLSASLLVEEASSKFDRSEVLDLVAIIQRSGASMLLMIADLLDLERLDRNMFTVTPLCGNLSEFIREQLASVQLIAQQRSVAVISEIPEAAILADFDGCRLTQVFSNLFSNALKFTPRGGTITVRIESDSGKVVLSVHNSGPGIAQEQREQLFERSAQLTRGDDGGLGLGLYICRAIVEAHGWTIAVSSELGNGSCFMINMPQRQASGV